MLTMPLLNLPTRLPIDTSDSADNTDIIDIPLV